MFSQVSPLRYPGGKSQFFTKLVTIFEANNIKPNCTYIEPFAGGSGIAIKLLMEGLVNKIIINDRDRAIYAFWYSILNHKDEFVDLLMNVDVSIDEWRKQKNIYKDKNADLLSLGFATFFLNRTNRSGIIKANPIGGINQTNEKYTLSCRFNKDNLIKRITAIYDLRDKITVTCQDAIEFINDNKTIENAFWFIDPPYYKRGKQLYSNYYIHKDHEELAKTIKVELRQSKWILTYDVCDEIKNLYSDFPLNTINLLYSVQTKRMSEELIYYNNIILSK